MWRTSLTRNKPWLPHSASPGSLQRSQPLRATNLYFKGATVEVLVCNLKFVSMYRTSFYSQPLSGRAAGSASCRWGTETEKWVPRPSYQGNQAGFEPGSSGSGSSGSKPRALSAPVHFISVPKQALALSLFLTFPLVWSYGPSETKEKVSLLFGGFLKEKLKFFSHFKHSVAGHSSSSHSRWPYVCPPWWLTPIMTACEWGNRAGPGLQAETAHRCPRPLGCCPQGTGSERPRGRCWFGGVSWSWRLRLT